MSKSAETIRILASGTVAALGAAGAVQAQDFNGAYVGLSLGVPNGTYELFTDYSIGGTSFGAFAGYNAVRGDWLIGGEIAGISGLDTDFPSGSMYAQDYGVSNLIDLKARVGRVFGNTMVYGAVGLSRIDVEYAGYTDTSNGVNFGVGVEQNLGGKGFIGAEVLGRNFNSGDNVSYIDSRPLTTVSIRGGFRF